MTTYGVLLVPLVPFELELPGDELLPPVLLLSELELPLELGELLEPLLLPGV